MNQSTAQMRLIILAAVVLIWMDVALPSTAKATGGFSIVLAQAAPAGQPAAQPAQTQQAQPGVVVRAKRNYYGEVFLIVVLFAAALFAVCKSSRRT